MFPAELTADDLEAPFVPSPEQIAAGCAAAQRQWSPNERRRRKVHKRRRVEIAETDIGIRRVASTVGRD